jgi:hypothetical protein
MLAQQSDSDRRLIETELSQLRASWVQMQGTLEAVQVEVRGIASMQSIAKQAGNEAADLLKMGQLTSSAEASVLLQRLQTAAKDTATSPQNADTENNL